MTADNSVSTLGATRQDMKEEYHKYTLRKVLFMLGCGITLIILFGYALTIGSHQIDFFTVFTTLWNHITGVTYPIGTPEWTDDYLLLLHEGSPTCQHVIPRSKIQSGVSEVTWGQRRRALATLEANSFTGSQSVVASLVDVSAEETNAYLDWLKPRS